MIERLFSSRVRVGMLKQFLLNPDQRYYARMLSGLVGAQYSAVWKELRNLEGAGLLLSKKDGGRRLFWLNPDNPILSELRAMILKTVGAGDLIRGSLEDVPGIEAVFIFGSFASGEVDDRSDLDLMIIGGLSLQELADMIAQVETDLDRSVNYLLLTLEEWQERVVNEDPFLMNLLSGPKVMGIGSEDALR